eukprot:GHVQ01021157.1.p1 GENE.GHVQ01021157.1~~GHVQ01021157.1.p1  ORF type:complete len:186 (+),score=24.92 GHVQ01021157.1:213-770(+)
MSVPSAQAEPLLSANGGKVHNLQAPTSGKASLSSLSDLSTSSHVHPNSSMHHSLHSDPGHSSLNHSRTPSPVPLGEADGSEEEKLDAAAIQEDLELVQESLPASEFYDIKPVNSQRCHIHSLEMYQQMYWRSLHDSDNFWKEVTALPSNKRSFGECIATFAVLCLWDAVGFSDGNTPSAVAAYVH